MNRKASSVASLTVPTSEMRRLSIARGSLSVPSDSSRRSSNVAQKSSVSRGPTLVGLLASKRLAKRLTTRFFNRRGGRLYGSRVQAPKEPSYRMEPHSKFSPEKVEEAIAEVLESRLEKFKYNPKFCANMSKVLADEIRDKIKSLNFDRYKIVSHVVIGERKDQAMTDCSRAVWDDRVDNYASYTFENAFIFCTATVYGIYTE